MIKFGIIYPSSRNKSYDDTFLLEQRLLQQENRKKRLKSLSYGDTAKFEIAEEEINSGTVVFEINAEELFAINDLRENQNEG